MKRKEKVAAMKQLVGSMVTLIYKDGTTIAGTLRFNEDEVFGEEYTIGGAGYAMMSLFDIESVDTEDAIIELNV